MSKPKPCCQELLAWLKANLGPKCLAPLTGTDAKALAAAVHILELWSYSESPDLLQAFAIVVRAMQRSTQELAYHAIAKCSEWHHREPLWRAAELDPIPNPRICAYEPGGSARS